MFKDKVVVVTGGARGIGKVICDSFKENRAHVCTIDVLENDYFIGDVSKKEVLDKFSKKVIEEYGKVDVLVNNAIPIMKGIENCSYEEFQYALSVGITAPFYLSKLFFDYFEVGGSIINISSSRNKMSQPQTESYSAAKGGISSLTHAMAMSFSGKVRVNSISPGWIKMDGNKIETEDIIQHPAGRIGNPKDISNMVLFLASDKAEFITGEDICIDGGMTRQMIYHGDNGWKLQL